MNDVVSDLRLTVPGPERDESGHSEDRMSAVAPAATVSAESVQPPNTTDVSGPSVHPDVKLSPVQIPVEVPLTDQPTTAGLGIVVLPMIRKRQAPLNVMPLRRPASHSN